MKTTYTVYDIDSKVYAIAHVYKDNKQTNAITIYEAFVDNIYISKNDKTNIIEIEYLLRTPKGDAWGDSVSSTEVSEDFDELVNRMKPFWLSESNTFGD